MMMHGLANFEFPLPVLFFASCCFVLLHFASPLPADLRVSHVFPTVFRE